MTRRSHLLVAGLTIVLMVLATAPAVGKAVGKFHFHDVFTSDVYDCDGTPAQDHGDIKGNVLFNLRGSSPFGYFRDSTRGTIVTTNLDTGGTFTQIFTANSHDHRIVDNGDGTITITVAAAGGARYYDSDGKLVLKDPGAVRFSFGIDYNGTPDDPSDDEDVPNSFQIVKESTGLNDTQGRNFCDDLREFAT